MYLFSKIGQTYHFVALTLTLAHYALYPIATHIQRHQEGKITPLLNVSFKNTWVIWNQDKQAMAVCMNTLPD